MAQPAVQRERRRPFGIKVLVALAALQAALLLLIGGLLAAYADDPDVQDALEATSAGARAAGIVLLVLGVAQAVLAAGLRRGNQSARTIYGALATIQTGTAVYALVALRDVRAGSLWPLALSVAVLWFLYGPDETEEFFRS